MCRIPFLKGFGEAIDTTLAITPKDFENNAHEYDGMTIPELGHQITQLHFRGTTGVEAYEVERHIRFAAPCTTFVLVFMGVIVSARKSRGGTGFQIALGFLLAFVFILFFYNDPHICRDGLSRTLCGSVATQRSLQRPFHYSV